VQSSYDTKSEKIISDLLLSEGWADSVHWDRNDWYIQWSEKSKHILYRIPAILKYWYDLDKAHFSCIDFMTRYFGLTNKRQDALSINMQETIIGEAQKKLKRELPSELIENIRNRGWSYMGLEMILDTVKALDENEIEEYLRKL
jgi:uncharacterized protein with HEPN domain